MVLRGASDVGRVQARDSRVVVTLDEFPSLKCKPAQDDENICYLRFLRNVIRSLKFELIIMGTNTSAANTIGVNAKSRGADKSS